MVIRASQKHRTYGVLFYGRRVVLAMSLFSLLLAGLSTAVAYGGYEWLGPKQGKFAGPGTEGDLGSNAMGLAVDYATDGKIYVADGSNHRVTRFTSDGNFLGASGWDVTATGPDKAGLDEEESITITAASGKFTLSYEGDTTSELNFNEGAVAVETALNGLESIVTDRKTVPAGGRVKVSGGPGDGTGSKPYLIRYEGALGDQQQSPIFAANGSLAGGSPLPLATQETLQEGAAAFEDCSIANHDTCRQSGSYKGEGAGELGAPGKIAVDPSTGYVYVLDHERVQGIVQVFNRDGELVSEFGERGKLDETAASGLERIQQPGGIAVDSNGDVYVTATPGPGITLEKEARVMIFKPETPGDYEHYVYTGETHDIKVGMAAGDLAIDSADDVYVIVGESQVYRFLPTNLAELNWEASPGCKSTHYGRLLALTVNPSDGDVFIFGNTGKKLYRLSSGQCAQTNLMTQIEEDQLAQNENETEGLAFNPTLKLKAEGGVRPMGTLYALDPYFPVNSGLIFGQALVVPPSVGSESVAKVGATQATLQAQINPKNSATHYFFQYSTQTIAQCSIAASCHEAPVHGGDMAATDALLTAAATVAVEPETSYHFRVITSSHCNPEAPEEVCETIGDERAFTTFPMEAEGLPDDRAYELVSSLNKNGEQVFPVNPLNNSCNQCLPGVNNSRFPMQSNADGSAIVYEGGPFSAAGDAVNENEYFATRAVDQGWGSGSRDLSPTLESAGEGQGYRAVSPDLRHAVLYQIEPALSSEGLSKEGLPYANLYLQDVGSSHLTAVLTSTSVAVAPHRESSRGSGHPENLQLGLAGASADFGDIVFEANDALTVDAPTVGSNETNIYEWTGGHLGLVNILPGNVMAAPNAVVGSNLVTDSYSHAISEDARRIFWTAQESKRVYMRENGDRTVKIPDPGQFLTASIDGSKVLLDDGELYNVATKELINVTAGNDQFQGLVGASADLSVVYFVEEDRLYVWTQGTKTLIATLTPDDGFNGGELGRVAAQTSDWADSPANRTTRVTADGRYLAFMSTGKLTSYDNTPAESSDCNSKPACAEVYLYDSATQKLICASCNPTGDRPAGSSVLGLFPTASGPIPPPENLLDNGRIFFESADGLSPRDRNGGVDDVYEYEPDGVGTCTRVDGCISLISNETGKTPSTFVNATPSGGDVFFTTRSQLVAQDRDDLVDLYDAREPHVPGEQVGFLSVVGAAECSSTDECRGVSPGLSSIVNLSPDTAFGGPGNLVAPVPAPVAKPLAPTSTQLLAKALHACKRQKTRHKRAVCEERARKRYRVARKAVHSNISVHGGSGGR